MDEQSQPGAGAPATIAIAIYVAQHCESCEYALEMAIWIRQHYPNVQVRVVDLAFPSEPVPETVFATPTYLLNGRVWSLGNPPHEQVRVTLAAYDEQDPKS